VRPFLSVLQMLVCVIVFIVIIILWFAGFVKAHEADTPFSQWFMSLKQPDNPIASCCGPADQFYVDRYEVDHVTGGFTATVEGFDEPIYVPPEKVNWHDVNPTGRGVIFMSTSWVGNERIGGKIYCFVPGIGT
jgi:hypothetical protein